MEIKIDSKLIESVGKTVSGQWQIILSRDISEELINKLVEIGQKGTSIGNTEENRERVAANFLKRMQQSKQ